MKLKELFTDDDAVSPVIGVILMVAITVILAAVIASFVLGLGQQTGNEGPTASFGFDYTETGTNQGELEVNHQSGDTITANELYLRGSGFVNSGGAWHTLTTVGTNPYTTNSEISSGSSITIDVNSDFDISVVWESTNGDTSKTLSSETGPDA